MKNKRHFSEEDIQKALNKFLSEGGLIKHLPDEITPVSTLVGAKWGMFENVLESSLAGSETVQ